MGIAIFGDRIRDKGTLAAAGTVIGNAAAIVHDMTFVTGADDSAGVQLPTPLDAGELKFIYSDQATNGLKVYPPVNGTINGGSANAAITIEGNTPALFFATNSTNWAAFFTANA